MLRAFPLMALLMLVACGDALTDARYRGAPIFKIEGQITTRNPLPEELLDANFAVSMFWTPNEDLGQPMLLEQPSVTTDVRFPSTFELRVFEPPTDEHLGSDVAPWGVGLVLVYVDADNNGRLAPFSDDLLIGGSIARGLIYARTALEPIDSPTGEALPAGFSVVDLPLNGSCESLPRKPVYGRFFAAGRGCSGCPGGFVCDASERVCVPDESFNLVILPDFGLASVICEPGAR